MDNEQLNTETYERAWGVPAGALRIPAAVWFDVKNELNGTNLLEIGAGIKPSIPILGNHFLDISETGVSKLRKLGGIGVVGSILKTDFETGFFDGVFAFEIFEHVEEDQTALQEVNRILSNEGLLVLSIPLHTKMWTEWDVMASHVRRYEPSEITRKLNNAGFEIIKYVPRFGFINRWSVALPVWINRKFPKFSGAFIQYAGYYPQRFLEINKKIKWREGYRLDIPGNATGVTIVAKKR